MKRRLSLVLAILLSALSLSGCLYPEGQCENTFKAPAGAEVSIKITEPTTAPPETTPPTTAAPTTTPKPTEPELMGRKITHIPAKDGKTHLPVKAIEKNFKALIKERGLEDADFACLFEDLETGEIWGLDVDKRYEAASTIKLPAAMYSYEMAAKGEADLEELMEVEEDDLEMGDGPVTREGEGKVWDLRTILDMSIIYSDNTANRMVFRYWQDKCPEKWLVLALDSRYDLNYNKSKGLSPEDAEHFLKILWKNENGVYDTLLENLQHTSYGSMVQAALPVAVAQKYGKLDPLFHDVGLAFAERPFAFAIYTDGLSQPNEIIGELALAYYSALTEAR